MLDALVSAMALLNLVVAGIDNSNCMESDINYPKSKAFNILLRLLQVSLSMGCTVFVAELVERQCVDDRLRLLEALIAGLLVVSLVGLLVVKCSSSHPKCAFALLLAAGVGLAGAVGTVSAMAVAEEATCAVAEVLYEYCLLAAALYLACAVGVLVLPLLWVQRYTNSPGNLVWVFFFAKYALYWDQTAYRWTLAGLAAAALAVSLLTLIVNLLAGCSGLTSTIRSLIRCSWAVGVVLLVAGEGVVAFIFKLCRDEGRFSGFVGVQARTFLGCFLLINLVDMIFWLYGLQTLDYERGDSVREELVKFGRNPQYEESDVNDYDPPRTNHYGQLA